MAINYYKCEHDSSLIFRQKHLTEILALKIKELCKCNIRVVFRVILPSYLQRKLPMHQWKLKCLSHGIEILTKGDDEPTLSDGTLKFSYFYLALKALRSQLTKRQRQKGSPIFHANRSPTPLPHSPNADSRQSRLALIVNQLNLHPTRLKGAGSRRTRQAMIDHGYAHDRSWKCFARKNGSMINHGYAHDRSWFWNFFTQHFASLQAYS
ncbi:hypothetical protein LguiA_033022 [Lonicera macranthoides]